MSRGWFPLDEMPLFAEVRILNHDRQDDRGCGWLPGALDDCLASSPIWAQPAHEPRRIGRLVDWRSDDHETVATLQVDAHRNPVAAFSAAQIEGGRWKAVSIGGIHDVRTVPWDDARDADRWAFAWGRVRKVIASARIREISFLERGGVPRAAVLRHWRAHDHHHAQELIAA